MGWWWWMCSGVCWCGVDGCSDVTCRAGLPGVRRSIKHTGIRSWTWHLLRHCAGIRDRWMAEMRWICIWHAGGGCVTCDDVSCCSLIGDGWHVWLMNYWIDCEMNEYLFSDFNWFWAMASVIMCAIRTIIWKSIATAPSSSWSSPIIIFIDATAYYHVECLFFPLIIFVIFAFRIDFCKIYYQCH